MPDRYDTPLPPPPAGPPLLQVRGLSKHFFLRRRGLVRGAAGRVRAIDGISFDLRPGEALGLVGESGSGKTTVARCILRALTPTAGEVWFRSNGTMVDLARLSARELKPLRPAMQLIFQDPYSSLNPRLTVGQIVGEPLVIHRLARGAELEDRVADMLVRIGLKPEDRTRYPQAFSGGQRQRIGIARALIMHPALVVADEAVSALDVSMQAQVLNLLKDLQEEFALTYIFVAHNLDVVRYLCNRVAVMYAGRIVELAETDALFQNPRHPYTQALRAAVPRADPTRRAAFLLGGEPADPGHLPSGCAFHPRCPQCFAPCSSVRPELKSVDGGGDDQRVACHLYGPAVGSANGAATRTAGLPGAD